MFCLSFERYVFWFNFLVFSLLQLIIFLYWQSCPFTLKKKKVGGECKQKALHRLFPSENIYSSLIEDKFFFTKVLLNFKICITYKSLIKYFRDLIYETNQIDNDLYSSFKNQVSIYAFFFLFRFFFFLIFCEQWTQCRQCGQVWAIIIIPISTGFPLLLPCTFGHIHGLCFYPICSLFKLMDS